MMVNCSWVASFFPPLFNAHRIEKEKRRRKPSSSAQQTPVCTGSACSGSGVQMRSGREVAQREESAKRGRKMKAEGNESVKKEDEKSAGKIERQ